MFPQTILFVLDLPEWSTSEAEDMDNIGTFDSSGAFMFVKVS